MKPTLLRDRDALIASGGTPIWIEYATGWDGTWAFFEWINQRDEAVLLLPHNQTEQFDRAWYARMQEWPMSGYGRTWRCWTCEPTEAETEAETWL